MFNLASFWNPNVERCGYITKNLEVVELNNESLNPDNHFQMVLPENTNNISHLWHTHPKGSANLSIDDYKAFVKLPQYKHLIISKDEIREYYVINGVVYQTE